MRLRWIILLVAILSTLALTGAALWRRVAREIVVSSTSNEASFAWPTPQPAASDWPWWRGANADGISTGEPPLNWSLKPPLTGTAGENTNIAWRTEVPGRGHASPIVWGSQVFLASADESQKVVSLLSFDRRTGKQQWACEVQRGGFPKIHVKNSYASATPACDGRHVYVPCVADERLSVTAVTVEGKIAWRTDAGPYRSDEGFASSLAIHESLVIVAGDSHGATLDRLTGAAFIAALDRRSGNIVWRVKRPAHDGYASPVVARVGGRVQLLVSAAKQVASYDPSTGAELWKHEWPLDRAAGNPAFDQERVFVSGTIWQAQVLCLRGDPSLPANSSRQVWDLKKGVADVPAPLVIGDRLFILNDGGTGTCCAVTDGQILWKKRLKGRFSASPVSAGGRIYVANEEGVTLVVDSQNGETLAENALPEPILATPALAGRQIFIRTSTALYSIEQAATATTLKAIPAISGNQAN